MKKTILVLFVFCFTTRAFAWTEPDDFRGLKFGQELLKITPECPHTNKKPNFNGIKEIGGPCWLQNPSLDPAFDVSGRNAIDCFMMPIDFSLAPVR